jgi:hypothetical protein
MAAIVASGTRIGDIHFRANRYDQFGRLNEPLDLLDKRDVTGHLSGRR